MINVRPLKLKATALAEPLRSLVLTAPDKMTSQEFAVHCETWLRLLTLQEKK